MTIRALNFAEDAVVLTALIAARIGTTIASKALRVAELTVAGNASRLAGRDATD